MAVIQMDFMAQTIQRFTSLAVILPSDGEKQVQQGPFPVLYLLHGHGGNYLDWICNSRIALWAKERNIAVVMPSGENAYYLNYPERAEDFQAYIGEELPRVCRALFPISENRRDTWIAGLSMGGGGAIRCGLRYGAVFSKAAGLSAGLTVEEEARQLGHGADLVQALKESLQKGSPLPELFLTIGLEDPLLETNRKYHQFLIRHGVEHRYEEHPGAHNWAYWDGHICDVLDWMLEGGEQHGNS